MRKDKLLDLLRSFSSKELDRFVDYVHSPYFNKRRAITEFCDYLVGDYPAFPPDCLEVDRLPLHILPAAKKTKKELSYLKSDLFRLALNFLAYEQLRQAPHDTAFKTIIGLQKKNSTLYFTQLSDLNRQLNQAEKLNQQQLILHYFVTSMLRREANLRSKNDEDFFKKAIQQLDEFYFINKLSFSIEMQNHKQIMQYSSGLTNPLMEEIEALLRASDTLSPRTAIYYQLYLCIKDPREEAHADHLVLLLRQYYHLLEATECRGFYLVTINICMRLSRIHATKYLPLCLELYQHGIQTEILFENGILTEWTYKNTIKLGLKLQRFQWTETFIREYNVYLAADARKNALASNLAELAFSQEDYDLTLEHLNKIKTTHFKYYLSTKILLIKTFYETQNIDSCLSALGAFTVYLSRLRGVSPTVKKNCQHFCRLLHATLMQSSDKKKAKTKLKIQRQTPLAEREWLLEVFQREHPRI